MAIQQTKRQSDLEKRLQILRKQVYGKNEFKVQNNITTNSSSDLTYLGQDLLKSLLFSSAAIGIQLVLFTLIKNNILKLNLF